MASRLNPYLSFDGDARSAMEFYQSVFGGSLVMNTFGECGAADMPDADKVMHAMLEADNGFTLMGSDTPPGMAFDPGSRITISLSGEDGDVIVDRPITLIGAGRPPAWSPTGEENRNRPDSTSSPSGPTLYSATWPGEPPRSRPGPVGA